MVRDWVMRFRDMCDLGNTRTLIVNPDEDENGLRV